MGITRSWRIPVECGNIDPIARSHGVRCGKNGYFAALGYAKTEWGAIIKTTP